VIARRAIVVADDLGYDPAIDEGILRAHRQGVVTAASALVVGPFAEGALAAAPSTLPLGLHLALVPGMDAAQAEAEIRWQLERFMVLRGALPVHLDGHRHIHAEPPVLEGLLRVAAPLRLRVRALDVSMRERVRASGARACDAFLGDADLRPCWTAERLLAAIPGLVPGTSEIMMHPGLAPVHVRTSFGAEREVELSAAVDPRVRAAFRANGIVLSGFLPE